MILEPEEMEDEPLEEEPLDEEPEELEEEEPDEEEPDEEPGDAPAPRSTGLSPSIAADLSEEEREQYRELMYSDPLAAMESLLNRKMERFSQSLMARENQIAIQAQQYPEFNKVHGTALRHVMAQLPPEQQGTEEGFQLALMGVAMQEVRATGDPAGTFARMSKLLGGREVQAAPRPRAVTPPTARTPSPTTVNPDRNRTRRDPEAQLMKQHGLSRAEARAMLGDERITG